MLSSTVPANIVTDLKIAPPTGHTGHLRWLKPIAANVLFLGSSVILNLFILLLQPLIRTPLRRCVPFNALREGRRIIKQLFGLTLVLEHQWFAPTTFHITSGDDLPLDELFEPGATPATRGDLRLPKRVVIVANHQVYPDFVFIWILAYLAKFHGAMMIFLKDGFKNTPIGMRFFDFVFLRRRWEADRELITRRVNLLKSGWEREDPLAMLIFPEGTILTEGTKETMIRYAEKEQLTIPLPRHCLLPRITGIQHVLRELRDGDVDYLYDVTVAFEGVPPGSYPHEVYTLRSVYMLGGAPPAIHLHIRRWHIATQLPSIDDTDAFTDWLRARWMEKDRLLDRFYTTGSMAEGSTPAERAAQTVVRPVAARNAWLELLPIFLVALVYIVLWRYISCLLW